MGISSDDEGDRVTGNPKQHLTEVLAVDLAS